MSDPLGGRGHSAVALAAVLGVAFAAWLFAHRDLPWALFSGDEMEYAEIARRIAEGRGFTTGVIFPVEIAWGVHDEHPSLLRPPLWPLVLSGAFALAGSNEPAAHAAVLLCLLATVAVVFALGHRLSGPVAGAVAGLAVGLSPVLLMHAVLAGTEILLALWIALVFYALASECDPFWSGLLCGLAYLTRYNGALLLPIVLLMHVRRPLRSAPLARCVLGFLLVCLPWWVRNFVVTGEPFFSLYNLALWVTPEPTPPNGSLLYMIEPDLTSAAAMHPLRKAVRLLPVALSEWPLAAANLFAFVGALLGCARRDRLCVAFFGSALLMELALVFVAIRGRYLIPFVPTLLALGTAYWVRLPPRARWPALGLTLLLPLLVDLPIEANDTKLTRGYLSQLREATRSGSSDQALDRAAPGRLVQCLDGRPLLIARNAPAVAWRTGAVTLYMTRTEADFQALLERFPIEFVVLGAGAPPAGSERFARRFRARPECGPGVYQRRQAGTGP